MLHYSVKKRSGNNNRVICGLILGNTSGQNNWQHIEVQRDCVVHEVMAAKGKVEYFYY